jgi:hypothetical protein
MSARSLSLLFIRGQAALGDEHGKRNNDGNRGNAGGVGDSEAGDAVEIHDSKRIPLSEMERANRKGIYPYCGANGIIDYIDDIL